ncbi:MAG: hypothetical protein A2X59_01250 [Nitrospirae bacterium GWC2_42_7]|nr:MAG: hypothetical protein A2X59_01250 [Nitrospirae bacterium GWC2_42_7]
MSSEFEDFKKDFGAKTSSESVTRKQHQCPQCKEILSEVHLEQNPFPEIPCPECGSIISITSVDEVEIPHVDEREDKRCETTLKVNYTNFDNFLTEYTKNVSSGGMFIKTKVQHKIDSDICLYLHVPGLQEAIKIVAKVVHLNFLNVSDEEAGIGVQFTDIDEESRQSLIGFIRSQTNCA